MPGINSMSYKIVFLGSPKVGKSSLIQRFHENTFNPYYIQAAVAVNFAVKDLKIFEQTFHLQLWDMTGQNKTANLELYYKSSHALILVFDLSEEQSLEGLSGRYNDFKSFSPDAVLTLVGTKKDLGKNIDQSKIDEFMAYHKITRYFEASAKTGENVQAIFESIVDRILQKKTAAEQAILKSKYDIEQSQASMKQEQLSRNRNCLTITLKNYIDKIESNKKENGDINFEYDFWLFSETRGINRRVNYLIAKSLHRSLESTEDSIKSIVDNIPTIRATIVRNHQAFFSSYIERGINSPTLNEIISTANQIIEDEKVLVNIEDIKFEL